MSDGAKQGRPRNYQIAPAAGLASAEAAVVVALLDELLERLIDLIADLGEAELHALPEGCANSIQVLVSHMTWAEAHWIEKFTGVPLPDAVRAAMPAEAFARIEADAERLIANARTVREQYTRPVLSGITDIDAIRTDTPLDAVSVRGVLMHQTWHWTYHTGQVGLLRRMIGRGYQWTFTDRLTGRA